jgi:transposase
MENAQQSQYNSTCQSASPTIEPPFSQTYIHLTKQEYVQLKWNNSYWQRQHERAIAREAALKLQIEQLEAKNRDLTQRLYGKHTEKSASSSESQPGTIETKRPRGQQSGSKGHGRTPRPHLPVIEELCTLSPDEQTCPHCQLSYDPLPMTA